MVRRGKGPYRNTALSPQLRNSLKHQMHVRESAHGLSLKGLLIFMHIELHVFVLFDKVTF
jgi:hypothetical protein